MHSNYINASNKAYYELISKIKNALQIGGKRRIKMRYFSFIWLLRKAFPKALDTLDKGTKTKLLCVNSMAYKKLRLIPHNAYISYFLDPKFVEYRRLMKEKKANTKKIRNRPTNLKNKILLLVFFLLLISIYFYNF